MDRLDELKQKYASVLALVKEQNVSLKHLHVQDNKLYMQGSAPSEEIKNNVWNAIKKVDSSLGDIAADINVDSSMQQPYSSYTVKPGDSLSKIAKEFYGDMKLYPKIFEANRDQLSDPDKINVGQVLKIPPKSMLVTS
jgi:LysM repeat protein